MIKSAFTGMNQSLKAQNFDVRISGTTANVCFLADNILTNANVGDSRCVLGTLNRNGLNYWQIKKNNGLVFGKKQDRHLFWRPISLSIDHKPHKQNEKKRITDMGGVV